MKDKVKYGLAALATLSALTIGDMGARVIKNNWKWRHQEKIWQAIELVGSESELCKKLDIPEGTPLRADVTPVCSGTPFLNYVFFFPDEYKLKEVLREYGEESFVDKIGSGFFGEPVNW